MDFQLKLKISLNLQNSSVEGVFAPSRASHPFRIIENDAQSINSMTSLGRVGRILSGSVDAAGKFQIVLWFLNKRRILIFGFWMIFKL